MPWVKLDDGLWSHPKINGVSNDALALYICGLSYAGQYVTDGMLSYAIVERLAAFRRTGPSVTEELVDARLWERVERGFQIHDYLGYNKSRDEIERDRANSAQRQEKHRTSYLNGVSNGVTNDPGNAVSNGVTTRAPYPVPGPVPGVRKDSELSHDNSAHAPVLTFGQFSDKLRGQPANAQAVILADAFGVIYGRECKDFGRLGMLAKKPGAGETLKMIFACVGNWNGIDNPLDYVTAALNQKANSRRNGNVEKLSPNPQPPGMPDVVDWDRYDAEGNYWEKPTAVKK